MVASTKIVLFKGKSYSSGESPVLLRVTHARRSKYVSLGLTCLADQWDEDKCRFRKNYPDYRSKNQLLSELERRADKIIEEFQKLDQPFTFQSFEDKFRNNSKKTTVFEFFDLLETEMEQKGKVGNKEVYRYAKNALQSFHKNKNLMFPDITYAFLKRFETFLLSRGCSGGGVSIYMRTLRAVVNEAIRRDYFKKELYPFSTQFNKNGYSIADLKSEASPRALSVVDMEKIKQMRVEDHPDLVNALNYFLFSYYARGMNFSDMAKLKWSDIYNGRISYHRSKTKKPLSIKISDPIQQILEQYKGVNETYIFPILNERHQTPSQKKDRMKKCIKQYNKDLKRIGELLGIEVPLTSYVARHTYATTLKGKGVDVSIISEGLGHSDIGTTKAYLKKFEFEVVDKTDELL